MHREYKVLLQRGMETKTVLVWAPDMEYACQTAARVADDTGWVATACIETGSHDPTTKAPITKTVAALVFFGAAFAVVWMWFKAITG